MAGDEKGRTHFGYSEVDEGEKAGRVSEVFERVARRYDLMNDLMTGGLHRRWKNRAVKTARVGEGDRVLDLAGGTGDLAIRLAARVGETGRVTLADINPSMLREAERRLKGHRFKGLISLREADAEALPFEDGAFDVVTIGFGLRNVTKQVTALNEMWRVLGSGGRLVVLEFSRPVLWLVRPFYDAYSFAVIPTLGRLVLRDPASYRYLAESIRMHPDRDTLLGMLEDARFEACGVKKMFFGIVAIHDGAKPLGDR
jgi:demethylmenaquinone methyltransferase/2-methoxy-6-polyprenyl-1,4-benzoquinol methylase